MIPHPPEPRATDDWRTWGPYLSDRQWGTVREDYSADGNAWDYFPFAMARLRAYRWGEDGILGWSDVHQRLCFAPAFWNERDPILKERLFGLNGHEGNHGEDVKEVWFHLDGVPTHAYMKGLYRYPHAAFPYDELLRRNAEAGRDAAEVELIDTGVLDGEAFTDCTVEYAKRSGEEWLVRLTVTNRGTQRAPIHVLPRLWFRNEWAWRTGLAKPSLRALNAEGSIVLAEHATLGRRWMIADGGARDVYFTGNETDFAAAFGVANNVPYVKSGIDRRVVAGDERAVDPGRSGTIAAFHYRFDLGPGESRTIRLRCTDDARSARPLDEERFDRVFDLRIEEADRFYAGVLPPTADDDSRAILRASSAGLLWSKQFYNYVVRDWLSGDPLTPPPPPQRRHGRNSAWIHLYNDDILSMPDTWEYPWYACWDLAFHAIPLAILDPAFAKRQLITLTREWYMHPNGQLPAYEWAFDDVNPPVHAWAAYRVYKIEARQNGGVGDFAFLERVFQKLLLNFTWWVNRKDVSGRNVFQGGFLGLDNIGVFDRSQRLPTGGYLAQSDGTAWMGVYCLNMLAIAIELARHDHVYEDVASKFFEHFLYIADAMNADREDDEGLWDDEDEFYYDQLYLPTGERIPLKVRSLVGVIPVFAIETITPAMLDDLPVLQERITWFIKNRPELAENVARMEIPGLGERRLLAIVNPARLRKILHRVLDEAEFLSDYGVRSVSRFHRDHPYVLRVGGTEFAVDYEPGESTSGLFGGNSNWRGPIWFPLNFLLIESLQRFHFYLGDAYRVEFPTGSGRELTLWEVSMELSRRLIALFRPGPDGRRPFAGAAPAYGGPSWRDHLVFHEYFHGDTGAGLGASHQTGWTALVAKLIQQVTEYESPDHPAIAAEFDVLVAH